MRKFTAFLTSLLLIVSVFSLPAFAATSTPAEEIDLNKKGSLTLYKYEPGAGTDENFIPNDPDKLVSGAEFTAYQVIQITADRKYQATGDFEEVNGLTDLLEKDDGLSHTSTKELLKLIPALRKKAADLNGISSTEQEKGKYTMEDMELGIYLVVETGVPEGYNMVTTPFLVSVPEWEVSQDNEEEGEWSYDITAYPKNEKITVDKIIDDPTASDPYIYMIGDKVPYKVTSQIPAYDFTSLGAGDDPHILAKWLGKVKYRFIDTMSEGLTFNNDLKVTVGNKVFEEGKGKDYIIGVSTDTDTRETTITVKFNYSSFYELQGENITLTYSATLNKDAVVGPDGNPNDVYVKYTSDPTLSNDIGDDDGDNDGNDDDDDDNLTETEHSKTTVYTYGLKLTKLLNHKRPVANSHVEEVEFSMSMEESGTPKMWFLKLKTAEGYYTTYSSAMSDDGNSDGLTEGSDHQVQIGGQSYTVTQKLHPDASGELVVNGLEDGTYYLTEDKPLEGYVQPEGYHKFTINSENVDDFGYYVISVNNQRGFLNDYLPFTGAAQAFKYWIPMIGFILAAAGAGVIVYAVRRKNTAKKL